MPPLAAQNLGRIETIESSHAPNTTTILVSVTGAIDIQSQRIENPARVFVDFQNTFPRKGLGVFRQSAQTLAIQDPLVRQIRVAENQRGVTRVVLDLAREDLDYRTEVRPGNKLAILLSPVRSKLTNPLSQARPSNPRPTRAFQFPAPPTLSAKYSLPSLPETTLAPLPSPKPAASPEVALAAKTSSLNRSLTRVLGLKVGRVVIDAGHGGHDVGSTGRSGLHEKDVTLDVAKRLGALLEDQLGCEIVYTRTDDRYLALEERAAFANRAQADLFISIHANAARNRTAAGIETYYLNFTSSPEALEVAARENAVSQRSVNDLGDLVKQIALKDKLTESREFATKVHAAMLASTAKVSSRGNDRGVRKAPFVVLIGAKMPSILSEIGFLSNPKEEALLKTDAYRDKIAAALAKGIVNYANTLSHFQVAEKNSRKTNP
ncbi:MAG: N-acetylmuramoyl-L-alanine amidase [Bryobacter sp.]|nr:N-acetylmuramoyl-L-alanine amidase [Bryobacter sp.]